MVYKRVANLLDSKSNQPSKFRTKKWVEINHGLRGAYTGIDIISKVAMLRSGLCDYVDAYIHVKGTITITGAGDNASVRQLDEINKGLMFKNCAPFIKSISRVNNTGNVQDIDIVISMYNLFEYSDNYSKTSGGLWQYYTDDPNDNITQSESFTSKVKITGNCSR